MSRTESILISDHRKNSILTKNKFIQQTVPVSKIQSKMPSISTGLPLIKGGLEQPLLPTTDDESSELRSRKFAPVRCMGRELLTGRKFFNGFCVGALLQIVSLGSTAFIAYYYDNYENGFRAEWMKTHYEISFLFFYVLSQLSKWLLLPIIFCSYIGWARNERQEVAVETRSLKMKREAFVGRVRFHLGLVYGCFFVWSLVDLYFGCSLRVFSALVVSFLLCVFFCYGMMFIYDLDLQDKEENKENTAVTTFV